jgi:hypothetical protein
LYLETSEGFISERYIVRVRANADGGDWTIFFESGDQLGEATASANAMAEFWEKNDPIGR